MNDKRIHQRLTRKENAYLEITFDETDGGYVQKVIACETVDMSERGLKMYMSEVVQQGLITDILIELSEDNSRYLLTAEVKWITATADEGWFFAGFEIFDAEQTDFEKWCLMVQLRGGSK